MRDSRDRCSRGLLYTAGIRRDQPAGHLQLDIPPLPCCDWNKTVFGYVQ